MFVRFGVISILDTSVSLTTKSAFLLASASLMRLEINGLRYGLRLNRSDDLVEIDLDLDPRTSPLLGKEQIKDSKVLGRVSVKDWVHSLVVLSKTVNGSDQCGES